MTSLALTLRTPVLFLIFNRPEMTRRVFEAIRSAKPTTLFVAADGPRPSRPLEAELCNQARQAVLSGIDWKCEVKTLFRDKNFGCRLAVSSAITWFFDEVEEGIILEDDCLPEPSFFRYSEELLEKYRHDNQIMMISGDNFQPVKRGEGSYWFSRYVHIWGWATWRRAWQKYDLAMKTWPEIRDSGHLKHTLPPSVYNKSKKLFDRAFDGELSTWDIQWLFACWINSGLSITPNTNLVSNIDSFGTHMKVYDPFINIPVQAMCYPMQHPEKIAPHEEADRYTQRYIVFRDWRRVLELIVKYLWRSALKNPVSLPNAVGHVWNNCFSEIRSIWVGCSQRRHL